MSDAVATFIENVQGHTSALRDLENMHHQKLEEIAMVTLEKVVKNELDEDIPDDLREVLTFCLRKKYFTRRLVIGNMARNLQ